MGLNCWYDLILHNLALFEKKVFPYLASFHRNMRLICDALYYGLENAIQMLSEEGLSKKMLDVVDDCPMTEKKYKIYGRE